MVDGSVALGLAGANALMTYLEESWPEAADGESSPFHVAQWMAEQFEKHKVKPTYEEEGNTGIPNWRMEAIFVNAPEVWRIDCSFSCTRARRYIAIGSGQEVALGALYYHFEKRGGVNPEQVVYAALEAASYHDLYTAPPLQVQCINGNG